MPKPIKKTLKPKPTPKPTCSPLCEVNNPDKYPFQASGNTVMLRTDSDLSAGAGLSRMTLSGHLISV
jgi:hypothetical protein